MKKTMLGIAGLAALSACGANQEAEIATACLTIMEDPDMKRDIVAASVENEDFCACASTALLSLPEDISANSISAIGLMAEAITEHNGSAEDAFRSISRAARADDATPEQIANHKNIDELGEQLEEVLDGMRTAGGSCPV